MTKPIVAMVGSLLLLGAMLGLLLRNDSQRTDAASSSSGPAADTSELTMFCAASNRAVLEEIRADYQRETGKIIAIQYGPSQTLLSQIEVAGLGDLYLPADDSYLKLAEAKGLVGEVIDIAEMQIGVAVAKGNPRAIDKLADLLDPSVRLVQANPEAAAIGNLTRSLLRESGHWDALDQATLAYRATVNDVTNDLLVGAADAGIVYDAVLHTYPDLEFVAIPEFERARASVAVGVLKSSRNPAAARSFAQYLSADNKGLKRYASHGFHTVKSQPLPKATDSN